jgi:hypothetical protein
VSAIAVGVVSPGLVRTALTERRPDYTRLPPDAFVPATTMADTLVALLSGRYDVLHGRFVHVSDDLDRLVERIEGRPSARTLGLLAAGSDDPLA